MYILRFLCFPLSGVTLTIRTVTAWLSFSSTFSSFSFPAKTNQKKKKPLVFLLPLTTRKSSRVASEVAAPQDDQTGEKVVLPRPGLATLSPAVATARGRTTSTSRPRHTNFLTLDHHQIYVHTQTHECTLSHACECTRTHTHTHTNALAYTSKHTHAFRSTQPSGRSSCRPRRAHPHEQLLAPSINQTRHSIIRKSTRSSRCVSGRRDGRSAGRPAGASMQVRRA